MNISVKCYRQSDIAVLAQEEMKRYISLIFNNIVISDAEGVEAEYSFFLLTTECKDEHIMLGEMLGAQDYIIRTLNDKSVVLLGGADISLLWAVYELVEKWGVSFLHDKDIIPDPRDFSMPSFNIIRTPALKNRTYMYPLSLCFGCEGWSLSDYESHIGYLAKLRTNRIWIHGYPVFPWFPWSYGGIARKEWDLFFQMKLPIDGNTIGKELFDGKKEFYSPEIPLDVDFSTAFSAAYRLINGIIKCAKKHGMEVILSVYPLEYTEEFAPVLGDVTRVKPFNSTTIVPGPSIRPDDETLMDMAVTYINTALEYYPQVDYITPVMPEFRDWYQHGEVAFNKLDEKYHISKYRSYDQVIKQAESRLYSSNSPERNVKEAAGDLVAMYFLDRLFNEYHAIDKQKHGNVKLLYSNVSEELYPIFTAMVGEGVDCYTYTDYSNTWMVDRKYLYATQDPKTPYTCCITLHDDNVGFLPMLSTWTSLNLMDAFITHKCAGFYYRNWLLGDQDISMYAISHKAWDSALRSEDLTREFASQAFGEKCMTFMCGMFSEIENATRFLERYSLGFAFPVQNYMLLWNYETNDPPCEFDCVAECYIRAKHWASLAYDACDNHVRESIEYWINRLEFGILYIKCVELFRKAGVANRFGDINTEYMLLKESLQVAIDSAKSYVKCAKHHCDYGSIAALNNYAICEIRRKIDEISLS